MAGKRLRVSIISRESNERTLDVAMLEAELLKRGIDVRVLCRLLTKDRGLKSLGYAGHALRQEAAILGSDVVVLDTYCIPASMLPHRSGTKVLQIWHASSAIKKFGWQTVGREGGSSERTARLMRMHRGYDFVMSPSDITAAHFCEAFDVSPDRIVKGGLPRIDYIKSVAAGERRADMLKKIYARYPQLAAGRGGDDARKTVLYAPTFRRGSAVDVKTLTDAIDKSRYDVVVKLHPLYRSDSANGDGQDGGVIFDEEFTSFDWLSAADIIISDYSSLVVEAALADRPLFIYAYDLDDYEVNTGLNIDFTKEPIAPYVFRDAKQLAAAMDEEYDIGALRRFRDRYLDVDCEGKSCTEQLADLIESLGNGTDG